MADNIPTPGAEISGFIKLSSPLGPIDEKSAIQSCKNGSVVATNTDAMVKVISGE